MPCNVTCSVLRHGARLPTFRALSTDDIHDILWNLRPDNGDAFQNDYFASSFSEGETASVEPKHGREETEEERKR